MAQATMVFQVSSTDPSIIITSSPPSWVDIPVGSTVVHQWTASKLPVSWSVTGPPGMTIAAGTGLMTWTPQSAVSAQVTVTVDG